MGARHEQAPHIGAMRVTEEVPRYRLVVGLTEHECPHNRAIGH